MAGYFYLEVNQVLTTIRCDHTKAELPRSLRKAREGQSLYLPLRWEWIEGRGVIESAAAGVDLIHGDAQRAGRRWGCARSHRAPRQF